jgi:hypothetical protein
MAKKGKKGGGAMTVGEERCYKTPAIAARVAGALKAKNKGAKADGKCVKRTR